MTETFNTLGFIKQNSLTYTEIERDYQTFLDALTEDEKLGFKTLFAGTNSKILLDILSAKTSAEIYHIITSREETYLQYCNRLDSATAISQSKGYNTKRGSNIKIRLTIVPSESMTLAKFEPICLVEDYDLIVTEDTELVAGKPKVIDTYLGKVKEQTLIADSEELLIFRFTDQNISDQIALYLNGEEVPHTTNILEMIDDKYFCISNAYSGVDAIYLNKRTDFTHRYYSGSTLTLKYIKYEDIKLTSIEVESLYGDITSIEQISSTIKPETTASIKVNAQLYAEAQNRIVAREDFPKVLRSFNQSISDAVGHDYTPAIVQVTYVKNDGQLMSQEEYQQCYDYLYKRRGYGIPMCMLMHPDVMLSLNIKVFLKLINNDTENIDELVRKVLSNHEFKLNDTIDFSAIEYELEGYKMIETARIKPDFKVFEADTKMPEGTIIQPTTPNGKLYVVRNIQNITGEEEPDWPIGDGDRVVDNNILWECRTKSYSAQPIWRPEMPVVKGLIVWPTDTTSSYEYVCAGFTYRTGSEQPIWPNEEGALVVDNQIQWMAVPKSLTATQWYANSIIEKGKTINATYARDVSYQAINYIPTSPSVEPDWATDESLYTDDGIQYVVINEEYDPDNPSLSNIQLAWNQYVKFNETVTIV